MKRNFTKARLNDLEHRYRMIYESEDCEQGTPEARRLQYGLLRAIIDNPGLMDCGPVTFQTFKMSHDGQKWLIEMEAVSS